MLFDRQKTIVNNNVRIILADLTNIGYKFATR